MVCVCLRLLCRLVSQLPPAFPLSHCRTQTCRCAVPCVHACLRVPTKLAQHLERISVPLFCSHCLEWAKGGQVQGSTGSRFIFPFISILTLPCNHPHCRLFSMPGSFTRETVGGGKPGDGAKYKKWIKEGNGKREKPLCFRLCVLSVIPISFPFLFLLADLMVIIVGKTP